MPLVALLEIVWSMGVNTWDTVSHQEYAEKWQWRQVLLQVTNVRHRMSIPSPWQ